MNNYNDLDIEKRPHETAEILSCLLEEIGTMERSFRKILSKVRDAQVESQSKLQEELSSNR